ncbi:MAG: hypothetical protein ACT4PK_06590 [Gammaproteobacteria bacterium]
MRKTSLISRVLAAAVLAGQWLIATHDSDHGTLPGAAHDCVVCVYAHGAGNGALPTAAPLALGTGSEAPEVTPAAASVAVTVRLHPIRGPPALLS